MKKILLIILNFFLFFNSFGQQILESSAVLMSKNVSKVIKKLPEGSKISMVFFNREDNFSDTVKTYLGIQLTKNFVHALKSEPLFVKQKYNLLFPEGIDNKLYESMQDIFVMPDNVNTVDFWNDFLKNQTPDFYITGKYKIIGDYESISIVRMEIVPNVYGKYKDLSAVGIANITIKISKQADAKILKDLDLPINNLSVEYMKLIDFHGNGRSLSFDVINSETNKKVSNKIIIEKDYEVSIKLETPSYIYAFFYDPADKSYPYISMLFPYQNDQNKIFSAGKYNIPPDASFSPSPPATSQIYIKIIVSEEQIPISFSSQEDSEGYLTSYLNNKNCSDFIKELSKIDKSRIREASITYMRTEK